VRIDPIEVKPTEPDVIYIKFYTAQPAKKAFTNREQSSKILLRYK